MSCTIDPVDPEPKNVLPVEIAIFSCEKLKPENDKVPAKLTLPSASKSPSTFIPEAVIVKEPDSKSKLSCITVFPSESIEEEKTL